MTLIHGRCSGGVFVTLGRCVHYSPETQVPRELEEWSAALIKCHQNGTCSFWGLGFEQEVRIQRTSRMGELQEAGEPETPTVASAKCMS